MPDFQYHAPIFYGDHEQSHGLQLMTILEEACHSLIIFKNDPMLYEDSTEMVEYISQELKQASNEATVVQDLLSQITY